MYRITIPTVSRKKLVLTTALPYANGPLHIGHMAEAVMTCVFARYRRLCGQEVHFVGADDAHGSAIEISAERESVTPERYISDIRTDHITDYAAFDISYDAYHSTHSPENQALVEMIFGHLVDRELLEEREITQLYDAIEGRTLEDRRVRGTCPECGTSDQNGDSCDVCGATYDATQLINPVSTFSGEPPINVKNKHLFFRVEKLEGEIREWISRNTLQPEMAAKVREWVDGDLRDWCLTRSGPYFGFKVPDRKDLFFYVWIDAPVGYLAALQHRLDRSDSHQDAISIWNASDTEIIHIIGKDIINFHAILWPALLSGAGLALPDQVHAHGFVTVGGEKMSKSKGNFVLASHLAQRVESDALRWLLAARLGPGVTDIDLEASSAVEKINSDLVNKFSNIAVRLRPFANEMSDGLAEELGEGNAYQHALDQAGTVLSSFEVRNMAEAVRGIMKLADEINRDIAAAAPWKVTDSSVRASIVTEALVRFRVVAALVQPIAPALARRALAIFGEQFLPWKGLETPPLGGKVFVPARLFERIERDALSPLSSPQTARDSEGDRK